MATSKSCSENEPISFICHWHDKEILRKHLKAGLRLRSNDELILLQGYESLSAGYAAGEKKATHDLLVFVHQDVTLGEGWQDTLLSQIRTIERLDENWGLIGVYGCQWLTRGGELLGITAAGCGQDLGGKWERGNFPLMVDVIDPVVIVKRRGVLAFDPEIPTFHGAAEDICLSSRKSNRAIWVAGAYVVHHSHRKKSMEKLEGEINQCARALVSKWGDDIPSVTRIWEHSLAVLQKRSVNEICQALQAAQA